MGEKGKSGKKRREKGRKERNSSKKEGKSPKCFPCLIQALMTAKTNPQKNRKEFKNFQGEECCKVVII